MLQEQVISCSPRWVELWESREDTDLCKVFRSICEVPLAKSNRLQEVVHIVASVDRVGGMTIYEAIKFSLRCNDFGDLLREGRDELLGSFLFLVSFDLSICYVLGHLVI